MVSLTKYKNNYHQIRLFIIEDMLLTKGEHRGWFNLGTKPIWHEVTVSRENWLIPHFANLQLAQDRPVPSSKAKAAGYIQELVCPIRLSG